MDHIAEQIENGAGNTLEAIRGVLKMHMAACFEGNNYDPEWPKEAARRGLENLKTTPCTLAKLRTEKNKALFKKSGTLSDAELEQVAEVAYDNYNTTIAIEVHT